MSSYPDQQSRPLKRARFGVLGPDVYPQEQKQKEDDLSCTNVKHGFHHPIFDDEYKTAKEKLLDLSDEKINKFFNAVLNDKTKSNTISDPGKRKLGQNIRDIFWHVTQGSKVEPWLKDLAGTKPLKILARKVPIFNKKEDIFKNLCDYNVPVKRAVWFIKMTNSYHAALAESRVRNRGRQVEAYSEWAHVTRDFLKMHLQKIIDYYQGSGVSGVLSPDASIMYWNYGTQLAKHLYQKGLIDRDVFLTFLLDQLERQKLTDDSVLKILLGQILRYLSEFVQSQLLSRKLAYFCCKKIAVLTESSGCCSPRTQSPTPTTPVLSPPQNPLVAVFKEYCSCPQHRPLVLSLSGIIQVVVIQCPGALVWHNHGEGKMSSPLSGSPLDLLPCSPSCLPMAPGLDNGHLRQQMRVCEEQIRHRSRMSEARWSSDKCQQSAKAFRLFCCENGFTISKILQVLDKLDRQNFGKLEVNNFLDCLYTEVFGILQCKENELPISDEAMVNLLCEWAVSTQRTGEYRALIVAKLLNKKQTQVNNEKYPDEDMDRTSDSDSDIVNCGVPVFQSLLLNFLDNRAPYLEDNTCGEKKQAFYNLIHLFSELISHDVFSHDAYMCTLISRGDLSDVHKTRPDTTSDNASVRSDIHKLDENRMETEFDSITKASPGMPASVKSLGPHSVSTPGHPPTPMSQTAGRTPGGPTTPLGLGVARTPGAPHTPGAHTFTPGAPHTPGAHTFTPGAPHTPGAHTPGKAHTPLGAGLNTGIPHTPAGLTPGGPHTPSRTPVHGGPHTPGIVAYLSSGGHHSSLASSSQQLAHSHHGNIKQKTAQSVTEDMALRSKKHLCYATHFPIPHNDCGGHEVNQRIVMLYGVGNARDEARQMVKKTSKEMLRLFGKKNCIDVCSGEVKKKEKKKEKSDGSLALTPGTGSVGPVTTPNPATAPSSIQPASADKTDTDSLFNFQSTHSKFLKLSIHDQHSLTQQCTAQVLESIQCFSAGSSQHLPLIENITFLCDLMEQCYNVNVLVEFLVELLKELPDVEPQLNKKKSSLQATYCSSLCLGAVSVLRKYHSYLLLSNQLTCSVFESLCNIVKHVGNPADCTSAERCILAYLYDLFTTSFHVKTKFQELFSGASAKVKAALFAQVSPSASNYSWDPSYMNELIENPRNCFDPEIVKQILEPNNRYSFVCNLIHSICNTQNAERLNDLAVMAAELTSQCNALSCEWLGVLRALCCSHPNPSPADTSLHWPKSTGFMDILFQIELNDCKIHDSLAIFTALLVARHCFSIEDIIIHVALSSLLEHTESGTDTEGEQGARLTCHLLLRLFQTTNPSTTQLLTIKSSTDRHLLDAAHEACEIGAIVAVLKALIKLSDSFGNSGKKSSDSGGDIIQTLFKSLEDDEDDDDLDMGLSLPGIAPKKKGGENGALRDYAQFVLKEICSQDWVREKFLKDPEALLTVELLLDEILTNKQAQQLVHLICYPDGVSMSAHIDDEDNDIPDQKHNISRILHNMDQWKLRVSLLELQLMFKQAPTSELSSLLDYVSEATIEVFTNETQKQIYHHTDVVLPPLYEVEKESIWLIAPLVSKLSSQVQGRVLRAAGEELKTGNNFWTAKNANEKERYLQKSISLMGHQPFLSLVLTCLKGQDEQREGLLKSLYEQLEKFVNNTKEPQDRGIPTDDRLKLMMQESLRLRMSLVGGMFDTIQRSSTLLSEWAIILIQLISHGVVTLSNSAELFIVVLDMLSVLLHGTLVVDPAEGKDDKRTYSTLVRKLKKETENKKNESMDLVKHLLPLPKVNVEVIANEPHKVKKQLGFQVSQKHKLNPWDLLEGHKNPAPLSLAWFGAVKMERKPLKYEEQHRLLLYHTHSLKKNISHYLDPPPLPPEDLEPPPEPKDELSKQDLSKLLSADDARGKNKNKKKQRRTPTGPNYDLPQGPTGQTTFSRPGVYDNTTPQNWNTPYGPNNSAGSQQPTNYMQQTLAPGGSRFGPISAPGGSKEAINTMLQKRGATSYNMGAGPRPGMTGNMFMPNVNSQLIRSRLIKRNPMMGINPMDGNMYPPGMTGFQGHMGPNQGMNQAYSSGSYQQTPMGMEQGMGYNQNYQGGMGMQGNPQQSFMSPQGQISHLSNFRSGMGQMGSGLGGNTQMGGYSNMGPTPSSFGGGMQNMNQQQRLQQMRPHNMLHNMQQHAQAGSSQTGMQIPQQQQQTAALISHLQRQMSNPQNTTAQANQPTQQQQYANYPPY